ncbi:neuropeptide Y receptor type 2 isoform X2 [Hermetia illucens]|uniref:neuropeptide Y receptor type 2 isoform X2 n=1 Tax=Hermetia illucens TaxID=343691 RepID=UPI0018CC5572|nr:neuropeptide Y receptor type 2 isoform X2 [Hermetia illucens]XP_037917401.1 neuropeptide Y receptor type 2 isoform X2 [Hermetia illucens]XP_037917402.1 neuropeptide Y receptor type 2 isoform X2 [Hermetia illucens]
MSTRPTLLHPPKQFFRFRETSDNETFTEDELDANNNHHPLPNHSSNDSAVIDISKYDFPKDIWEIIPEGELILKVATFVPVVLLGIIGNAILLNIIMRNRALRTPTNLLIANMAAADTLTLVICPAMFMYHDFFQNYKLGGVGCKAEGFLEGSLLITAVLNLCAVSYDRLTAIVLPLETRLTIKGAKFVMIATWLVGFLLAAPLAIYRTYKERQWKNFLETYCFEDTTVLPVYWHVLIAALVWMPLGVMMTCYFAIFYKLDRYERQVLKREHPMSVSYKTKVAKMLFIVVIIFVVLRVPFTALVFIRNQMLQNNFVDQILGSFQVLWYASHYLIFFNAAINPLIYELTNDNFRRAYHQTPFLFCFYKPKIGKKKKANKPASFGRLFYGALQPRGPCGEDRFAGVKNLFTQKDKGNIQIGSGTSKTYRSTRITQLRIQSSKETLSDSMQHKDVCKILDVKKIDTETSIVANGFI